MRGWLRIGLSVFFTVSFLGAAACSDDEVDDGSGGGSGSGGAADASTGGSGGSGGGVSGSGGTGGGSAGSAGASGSAGAAGADAGPSFAQIQDLTITVDCTIDGGPDQVNTKFGVKYDNPGSAPVNGTLSSAQIDMTQAATNMSWTFKPSPGASGPIAAGGTQTVQHINSAGSGAGTGDPCQFCGGTGTLVVQWTLDDDAGSVVSDSFGPATVTCTN